MSLYDKYYYKTKYFLLEYSNTLELDVEYINKFMQGSIDNLRNNNVDILFKPDKKDNDTDSLGSIDDILEDDILEDDNSDNISKIFYKSLSKKLHPDKNKDSNTDDFIKLNEAYHNNDYLTLFILYYETKIELELELPEDIFDLIEEKLLEKEEEIKLIKSKVHWQWNNANESEKKIIEQHIINELNK